MINSIKILFIVAIFLFTPSYCGKKKQERKIKKNYEYDIKKQIKKYNQPKRKVIEKKITI